MLKFKTSICYILFIPTLFFEGFANFKIPAQNPTPRQKSAQPFVKCWETKNPFINQIASDNNQIILTENNGNIRQINSSDQLQNWNIQLGSKMESIPYLKESKLIILSYTNNKEKEKTQTDIRQIDSKTGLTNWINTFELPAKFSIIQNKDEKTITLISDALDILQIDSISGRILWKLNLKGKLRTYTSTEDSIYILTAENKLFLVNIKDGSLTSENKFKLENTSAISFNGDSLLLGNANGTLYKLPGTSNSEKKLLRTGGEISFIKNYESNLLVVSNDNFLYYYSIEKEKTIWKKRLSGRVILEPIIYNDLIFTTTSAEPVVYIFRRTDGLLINQINLSDNKIIKDLEVNENSIDILTNTGLLRFGVNCQT